jgi:pyridoxal phosphate enzyme (YggS family)
MHPRDSVPEVVDDPQLPSGREPTQAAGKRSPFGGRKVVVADDHAGASRQPTHDPQEVGAEPDVGQQPAGGCGVARRHRRAYSSPAVTSAASRLHHIRENIASAAQLARRDPHEVTLVAVSKTRSAEEIAALIEAGQRDFGESRVQEAEAKWPGLLQQHPGISLHCIGRLQSNKADAAAKLFDVIHSLDRGSLLDALVGAAEKAGRWPKVFVQVNVGEEEQKGGVALAELPELLKRVLTSHLPLAGLMAIPPQGPEPSPFFALLAKLAQRHGVSGLSMGMSGDYRAAVMLGATAVRVGTALFED